MHPTQATGRRANRLRINKWRDLSEAGSIERLVGIYESAQEVLTGADHHHPAIARRAGSAVRGGRCRTILLFDVLASPRVPVLHQRSMLRSGLSG
jgi:hypothetical protein